MTIDKKKQPLYIALNSKCLQDEWYKAIDQVIQDNNKYFSED